MYNYHQHKRQIARQRAIKRGLIGLGIGLVFALLLALPVIFAALSCKEFS